MTDMELQEIQNVRTRYEWAEIINADWRKSIESIILTGRDLKSAQKEIPYGGFQKMIEEDLPFSRRTAYNLMDIADHPIIADARPGAQLPSSWTILAKLSKLSAEDFLDAQGRGLIGADTSKRKAVAIIDAYRVPLGSTVGEGSNVESLPNPKEAKQVARATHRLIAASDGNLYSGSTDEEGAEYTRRRDQTYTVLDAINTIVDSGVSPLQWCEEVKSHWLVEFEYGRIETATKWLERLRLAFMRLRLAHDCEVESDAE